MPWKETCTMNEKMKFIADWIKDEWNLSELCRYYDISRPTAYKWVQRYKQLGPEGLKEMSCAPNTHPNATPQNVENMIVDFRRQHPQWGPKKLIDRLKIKQPKISWPAISTVGSLLKRHRLVKPRPRKRHVSPATNKITRGIKPNQVWTADFKGWFHTGDNTRIHPLTIMDWASRYLLVCHGMPQIRSDSVRQQFEAAFRECGLPQVIRTDNGSPFCSWAPKGLSRLAVWWIRLGIRPERIRPGHPEENSRHERMHRTLKEATAQPPRHTQRKQQIAFNHFREEYNNDRPHEGLKMQTPSQYYEMSNRPFPTRLPPMEYGEEFEVRHVRTEGCILWEGKLLFLSETLVGEVIGVKQMGEVTWGIFFGPHLLATYNKRTKTLKKV